MRTRKEEKEVRCWPIWLALKWACPSRNWSQELIQSMDHKFILSPHRLCNTTWSWMLPICDTLLPTNSASWLLWVHLKASQYAQSKCFDVFQTEMGSKNHEVVPLSLIVQISGLRNGGVNKIVGSLAKRNLIAKVQNSKCDPFFLGLFVPES